jgi:hypothetical protein
MKISSSLILALHSLSTTYLYEIEVYVSQVLECKEAK